MGTRVYGNDGQICCAECHDTDTGVSPKISAKRPVFELNLSVRDVDLRWAYRATAEEARGDLRGSNLFMFRAARFLQLGLLAIKVVSQMQMEWSKPMLVEVRT